MKTIPPHNKEAELNVISNLLVNPELISMLSELKPDDFYNKKYSLIYSKILELYSKSTDIDIITLADELKKIDKKTLWVTFLSEIIDNHITTTGLGKHVEIIKNKSILRKIINISSKLQDICIKEPDNIHNLLSTFETNILRIASNISQLNKNILKPTELKDKILNNDLSKGYKAGIEYLDDIWQVALSELVVVTGSPNAGKSEFMDYLATSFIKTHNWKFLYFSPENKINEHIYKLSKYFLPEGHNKEQLAKVIDDINNNLFFINYDKITTIDSILLEARALIDTEGINALVIDPYNQLEHQINKHTSETQYILDFLNKLTRFAKKYNIVIFIVAHPTKLRALNESERKAQIKKLGKCGTYEVAQLYHISGSAHWFNKIDVGFSIYRFNDNTSRVFLQKVRRGYLGRVGAYIDLRYNKDLWQFEAIGNDERSIDDEVPF